MRMRPLPAPAVIPASARADAAEAEQHDVGAPAGRAAAADLASWNAEWTRRAASAASRLVDDEGDVQLRGALRDRDHVDRARRRAPRRRAPATPGVPAMPRPTTAITATPRRAVTPSTSPASSSSRNAASSAATARAASTPGSVKPIELSEEDWKMVETETPVGVERLERARGDAGHAHQALAGDRDERLAADRGERLHRVVGERLARRDLGARALGVEERAHVERDAAEPSSGMSARGCSTLAPK